MPILPYAANALEPVISEQTVQFHYGKHLQNYVNTLLNLVQGTEFEHQDVERIVAAAPEGPLFNNAGQTLNHALYFSQFRPPLKGNVPSGKLADAINDAFGSFEEFKTQFAQAAATLFGSGWAWLSQDKEGHLVITKEPNGGNPVRHGLNPPLWYRCMGACLLSRLSEPARRPHCSNLGHCRLGCRGWKNEMNN